MKSGVAWFCGLLAVSLFQGGTCLESSADEHPQQVSTDYVEMRKFPITDDQKRCIERSANLAWGEMWEAIMKPGYWPLNLRNFVVKNADAAQGILLTILNPAAYATGLCLPQLTPLAPDRTFFKKSLENVTAHILASKISEDLALSGANKTPRNEQTHFERIAEDNLLKDPMAQVKREARKYAWTHIVPDALDAMCGGIDEEAATRSLTKLTDKILCKILRASRQTSFSYFSVIHGYDIGYQGVSDINMKEMSPTELAAYLEMKPVKL